MNSAASEKKLLREKMRALRRQLDPARKATASQAIVAHLEKLPVFQRARVFHTYVALRQEVDNHELIRRLLREGRRVAVPKVESGSHALNQYFITDFSELQAGAYGILEPPPNPSRIAAPELFDLVIVPGLAFDHSGHRLGAGKGYYDRFLAQVQAPKIALAFAFQIVDKIPIEPHDQCIDVMVTENEVIYP